MRIFVPKEVAGEERVALVPATAKKLVELGAELEVEAGLGATLGLSDDEYTAAGATVAADRGRALAAAEMVLRLGLPPAAEIKQLKSGCIHVSYLDPFNQGELLQSLAAAGVSAISMEMIPRTTLAQKMDSLSSQANLGGYVAVILAAARLARIFPMMMTPAGTISPARVFVIGAGVAGLQAIATAKRLGARVEAFDTRPVVAEQVRSLGGKFVQIDLGETSGSKDGYAKELTAAQLEKQREGMAKICGYSDVVITTAQVFGRPAPRIVTAPMLAGMKPGSVVVDMAVETGGNVEGSRLDEEVVTAQGVIILGQGNLPGLVAQPASQMYASNLENLVEHFWDKEAKVFKLELEDEIIRGCLVTHGGEVVHERLKQLAVSD